MDYRSPVLSMQRELETLEAELAALRAMPAPQPKKARRDSQRETHALRKSLKRISQQTAECSVALGVRALTPREAALGRSMRRLGLAIVTVGALTMGGTGVMASSKNLVWTETTCTFEDDSDGDYVASYKAGGHAYTFGASRTYSGRAPCWVAGPSVLSGVGYLEKPAHLGVPFRDKLSFGWSMFGGISVLLGLFVLAMNFSDEKKRMRREIEADVFDSTGD